MLRDPCGETMTKANPLPLLGSGEKGLRIHDLVKAPANTPWAKAKQQSWDASEPATVYTTPEVLADGTPCSAGDRHFANQRVPLVVVLGLHFLRLLQRHTGRRDQRGPARSVGGGEGEI